MSGKGALGGAIVAITLVLGVIYGIHSVKAKAKTEKRGMTNASVCRNADKEWVKIPAGHYKDSAGDCLAGTPPPPPPPPRTAEALVLEKECFTPCSATIAWRFKIIWGDSPLRITYPGGQIVDRRSKDEDFQAPSSMRSGETKFESLDPDHPHFRVQVYRVIVR